MECPYCKQQGHSIFSALGSLTLMEHGRNFSTDQQYYANDNEP